MFHCAKYYRWVRLPHENFISYGFKGPVNHLRYFFSSISSKHGHLVQNAVAINQSTRCSATSRQRATNSEKQFLLLSGPLGTTCDALCHKYAHWSTKGLRLSVSLQAAVRAAWCRSSCCPRACSRSWVSYCGQRVHVQVHRVDDPLKACAQCRIHTGKITAATIYQQARSYKQLTDSQQPEVDGVSSSGLAMTYATRHWEGCSAREQSGLEKDTSGEKRRREQNEWSSWFR